MQVIDASAIVHAWDNYPIEQFPPFWEWLEDDCKAGRLCIPQPAKDEVGYVSSECARWLQEVGITVLPVTNDVLSDASSIMAALGVTDDQYHPDGVDENDLLIIASSRCHGAVLISNEARQASLPLNKRKYRIPAVCTHVAPPPVSTCWITLSRLEGVLGLCVRRRLIY
ncbi:DUF4411 family protein [Stenotrophomonas sp. ISL-67]|uniref:DUF4411 family protein n=1 Tax=Stenotrophomonas sp. ISL-67 TaxID=2819171 RepID=UPI001BE7FC52|nr:DUF4411 family protein [Stenotrophomonas sp. ISL-67]